MKRRKQHIIEVLINVLSGIVLAFLVTQLLVWASPIVIDGHVILNLELSFKGNLSLTLILTTVSIGRSYFWRRFFYHRWRKLK